MYKRLRNSLNEVVRRYSNKNLKMIEPHFIRVLPHTKIMMPKSGNPQSKKEVAQHMT